MADLVTLPELKSLLGIDPSDTRKDAKFTAAIPVASRLISLFSERDFGAPNVTEDRLFEYDGSGYLDIDDASAVNSVAVVVPGSTNMPLDSYQWQPAPARRDDSPVYYYLRIAPLGAYGMSPEMGFTYNLDVLAREGRLAGRAMATFMSVNAVWGWPTIPDDIKMAAAWTIKDWDARDSGEGLSSEAIAGYSRTWAMATGSVGIALPTRVLDILAAYAKIGV